MSRKPKPKPIKITTRVAMRDAIKAAFEAHLSEPSDGRESAKLEHFLTLSAAIHLVADISDADLRMLAREADRIGFTDPALADAKKAVVRLTRWQALLSVKTPRRSGR